MTSVRRLYLESLDLLRRDGSDPLAIAQNELQLGDLEREEGRHDAAREHYRAAIETFRRFTPESTRLAPALNRLGRLELEAGDVDGAAALHHESLALFDRAMPKGLAEAEALYGLGLVARKRGDRRTARGLFEQAVDIQARIAPGTTALSESYRAMGGLLRDDGDLEAAAAMFSKALEALESQLERLGGTADVRSGFRDRHIDLYREQMELLLELQRREEAFALLERSRAQELLAMLAERDLTFRDEVPAELDRERRSAALDYDRAQAQLASLPPGAGAELVDTHRQALSAIRARQEDLRDRIRQRSPRLAALRYPEPAGVEDAARAVDAGTAVLAYAVGRQHTHVFAIDPTRRLHVKRLDAGAARLAQEVDRFRILIEARSDDARARQAIIERGRRLYELLVAPVEEHIRAARRVLIVPDGALNVVPFAALVRSTATEGGVRGPEYFLEWKPLHQIVSLSVYSEIKSRSGAAARATLVAFADPDAHPRPVSRAGADAAGGARVPLESLAPLPWSREEVRGIASLYDPAGATFIGDAATEASAKQAAGEAGVLHFATHALVDRRFPLDSGLMLAASGAGTPRENGLLQAWEVLEQLRLDAHLVVLSGCETGLGEDSPGGGLIGLSRAFLYAGARAVVASHWRIADRSTSALMTRFHTHLRGGRALDDALRAAQLDLIRGPVELPAGDAARGIRGAVRRLLGGEASATIADFSHPYHWAAFHLIGLPR